MGAIVDFLSIDGSLLSLFKSKYPDCVISYDETTRRYRLIVPNEDIADDDYYFFLIDSLIAMSSSSFKARLQSDKIFRERMTERAAANLAKMT